MYVGLFTGSHNAEVLETGIFRDVRIYVKNLDYCLVMTVECITSPLLLIT